MPRALSIAVGFVAFAAACWATAAVAQDAPAAAPPQAERPLDALAWIVGEWTDSAGEARVLVSCQWTKNRNFLTRQFRVADEAGAVLMEGTQVIGWDPQQGRVRSWTFDSEGGFGEEFWTRDGDRWLIKKSFTLATGERASALNVLTRRDDDTATWASHNREVDGRLLPSLPEVTVVRVGADAPAADQP